MANRELIEALLYEDEGSTLDFKRDQYPFALASEEQKSELIKDILAMVNAWRRRATSYILIGVEEVKGGRSEPVGVAQHLDEAALQQLVNSKTNRPVEFSYRTVAFEDVSLGVITIPPQSRPVFVKKDYGKLRAHAVYVRRGSSTAVADPDEVSRMGVAAAEEAAVPVVDVQFADPGTKTVIGHTLEVESTVVRLPKRASLPKLKPEMSYLTVNAKYYQEYADYLEADGLLQGFRLVLINDSSTVALNATLEIEYLKDAGLVLANFKQSPPLRDPYGLRGNFNILRKDDLGAEDCGDRWVISAGFGRVAPRGRSFSSQMFVGGRESGRFTLDARVFGDNLPEPTAVTLTVDVRASETPELSVAEFVELVDHGSRKR